jgi:hypothetical protein
MSPAAKAAPGKARNKRAVERRVFMEKLLGIGTYG